MGRVFRSVLGCGPRDLHQARNWIPSQRGGYNRIPPAAPLVLSRAVHELCDLINTGAELVDLKSDARKSKIFGGPYFALETKQARAKLRSAIMGVEPILIRIDVVCNGRGGGGGAKHVLAKRPTEIRDG
jgi:hypothetical protein